MRPSLDVRHVHVSKPWDGINFAGEISDRVSWMEMLVSFIRISLRFGFVSRGRIDIASGYDHVYQNGSIYQHIEE